MPNINPDFTGIKLFAVVHEERTEDTPAIFTSESDAEQFAAEISENDFYGGTFTVVDVLAIANYYTEDGDGDA